MFLHLYQYITIPKKEKLIDNIPFKSELIKDLFSIEHTFVKEYLCFFVGPTNIKQDQQPLPAIGPWDQHTF